VIVPPLGNEFNNMMKNTSLLYVIGVYELLADADANYSIALKTEFFLAVAFWYLMLTTVWTFIQAWIERKLAESERGDALRMGVGLALAWDPRTLWGRGMPWFGNR
jgi:polar amino acid transport system permease protein